MPVDLPWLKIESQNTIKNQRLSAGSTMIIRMKNVMMPQIIEYNGWASPSNTEK